MSRPRARPAPRKPLRDVRRTILASLGIPRDKQNLMATTGLEWHLVTAELYAMRKEGLVRFEHHMWRRTGRR